MRQKSKVLYHLILVASLSLVLAGCAMATLIGSRIQHEKLMDGVYEGSYRSLPNSAVVKVTITRGRIVNVELVKHFASWKGKKVTEVIPGRIVSEQSTVVDAVTGATNSSRVIMNAVQRAVEKAYK
ncbi:MAG: FMN-binding protein [Desulfobacterales bacterium]